MNCSQCQQPLGQNTFLGEHGEICFSCHQVNQQMAWDEEAVEATQKEWRPWSIMSRIDLVVYVVIPLVGLMTYLLFR